MKRPPAFQLYAREFLTSEKVLRMCHEALGAYILLLCQAWLSTPPGTLPDDDAALAEFSRLRDRWDTHKVQLRACFTSHNGRLVSERLHQGFLELEQYRQKQSEGGKKGALGRWGNDKSPIGHSMGKPMGQPMASDGSASATASAKETPPEPAVRSLIDAFQQQLEVALGEPPAVLNGGVLGKFFKRALKTHPAEEIKRRMADWFLSTDKFIVSNGYSPTLFCQKFNLLKDGPIKDGATYGSPARERANSVII